MGSVARVNSRVRQANRGKDSRGKVKAASAVKGNKVRVRASNRGKASRVRAVSVAKVNNKVKGKASNRVRADSRVKGKAVNSKVRAVNRVDVEGSSRLAVSAAVEARRLVAVMFGRVEILQGGAAVERMDRWTITSIRGTSSSIRAVSG